MKDRGQPEEENRSSGQLTAVRQALKELAN